MTGGDHHAAAAEAGRGRQDHAARPLPRRSRPLERAHYGVPFVRGPDELKDIPGYFGRARKASDMTKYDIQIFAEIVDASTMTVEAILERAEDYVAQGRRCDRSRLPSRHALSASRRGDRRAEGEGLQGRASTPPILMSCCAAARQAPTFCSASTRTRCTSPIKCQLHAGADPEGSWRSWPRSIAPWTRSTRKAAPISPTPCSIPSISAS